MKISCLLLLVVVVLNSVESAPQKCCVKAKNSNRRECYRSLDKYDGVTPTLGTCDNPCHTYTPYCATIPDVKCPECAEAKCYNDYCECKARFFLGKKEVNCTVAAN